MAAEILHFGGYIDGDQPRDPASADYVAGQPLELTAAGAAVSTTDANFAGIFKNDKSEDDESGPQAADAAVSTDLDTGRIVGTNSVRMTTGTRADGTEDQPFVFPGTGGGGWAIGDQIFNDASAKWDNNGAGAARGRVTKAPASATDDLIVDMFG